MRKQNTIKQSIEFQSVGLHSGNSSKIIVKPAPEDTGIVFVYKDAYSSQYIPFTTENVIDTKNNISVSNGKAVIKTI
jgi:UDP-3-O-[3-hydroxymyristoyl] N-acetylglucosamine deacetylase